MSGRGLSDRALIWGMAITQLIGWGTLFTPFPLMVAPMEAELGWSRVLLNGAYTAGLLAAGLAAVPAGRWFDRHGARGMMSARHHRRRAAAGGLEPGARTRPPSSRSGSASAWRRRSALWGIAMAVVVAEARDATRTITVISFVTGFTGTVFLPLTDALIGTLGWRGALQALAAMQAVSALITVAMLRARARARAQAGRRRRRGSRCARGCASRAFLGLALCFAAHAFIAIGPRRAPDPAAARTRLAGGDGAADRRRARPGAGGGARRCCSPPAGASAMRSVGLLAAGAGAGGHAGAGAGAGQPGADDRSSCWPGRWRMG